MFGEPIIKTRRLYPLPSLVTFSKVKHQKDEKIRKKMTDALLLSLQGHHLTALHMFQDAVAESQEKAA